MFATAILFTCIALSNVHIGINAHTYEEIDVSGISLQKASCKIEASENSPADCYGLYEMRDVLVNRTRKAETHFLKLVLQIDPFSTVIKKAIPKPQREEFQFHYDNWFKGNGNSLFYRIFDGKLVNDRLMRTGYVASFNKHTFNPDQKLESDNCQKDKFCVRGICRKETLPDKNLMITMVEKICPMFEFTLFTLAMSKKVGPISNHHITYKVKTNFFPVDVFITITYKRTSTQYSPVNVETIYYTMTMNGYIGVDYICDDFRPVNMISIDSMMKPDWTCGFHTSMSLYDCLGRKAFGELAKNPEDITKQVSFIDKVLSRPSFSFTVGHSLGGKSKELLKKLWFDENKYFSKAFLASKSSQHYVNGYLSFLNTILPSDEHLISYPGKQRCDMAGHGFTRVEYNNIHLVFLKEVNTLYDFTLLTLASIRALMSQEADKLHYRTQNPWNNSCFVDIHVRKSMDKRTITEIWYMSA